MTSLSLISQTFSRWMDHEGQRLGAALAFYTMVSSAPLLVFVLFIGSSFYDQHAVEDKLANTAQAMMGSSGSDVVKMIVANAHKPGRSDLASLLAFGALLFGASGAFLELRDDLNKMWEAKPRRTGWLGIVFQRIFAFVLVLAAGILLFTSMLITAALSVLGRFFRESLPLPPPILEALNLAFSFAAVILLFVLIYRFVPDLVLPWKVLWTGAFVSAVLFLIGKALLGLYLNKTGVGSLYGAAGSLVAIALWVFYSAQVFLLGAEFTYVWAYRRSPAPAVASA